MSDVVGDAVVGAVTAGAVKGGSAVIGKAAKAIAPKAARALSRVRTVASDAVDHVYRKLGRNPFGRGTLTNGEAAEIQALANKYKTQVDVIGSRAAGKGRNIKTDLPVGKEPPTGTRSDIDFRYDGQVEIDSRGAFTDELRAVGKGAGAPSFCTGPGGSRPPVIEFNPGATPVWRNNRHMESEVVPDDKWLTGDQSAARNLAATLTLLAQKDFAIGALAACCQVTDNVPPPIKQVVDVGREAPERAHAAFTAVRELTLTSEARHEPESPRRKLLYVAENAAKVIYNGTQPSDPFDLDSGSGLLHAIAAFHCVLPVDRRNTLAQRLLSTLREVRSSTENAKDILDPGLPGRWLLGDTAATQALATRIAVTQFVELSTKILVACTATLATPPNKISLVMSAVDNPSSERDLAEVSALTVSERAQCLANSREARFWSVAEQVVNLVRGARAGADGIDPTGGYYLLLAAALFYSSVDEEHRSPLRRDLVAALQTART